MPQSRGRPAQPHTWLDRPGVKDALAAGKSCKDIARLAGVTRQTVDYYKRVHLRIGVQLAAKAQMLDRIASQIGLQTPSQNNSELFAQAALTGSEFLSRSDELWGIALDGVRKTHKGNDFGALAPLLGQAHRNLELFGRHTGALTDGAVGNVTNVVLMLPNESRAPEHQGDTLEACVVADDDTST